MKTKYEGRVQGVGFRATVCDLSSNFRVVGWVRNLDDGSVEMLAEGESDELNRFADAIRKSLSRYIVHEQSVWQTVTKLNHSGFSIA